MRISAWVAADVSRAALPVVLDSSQSFESLLGAPIDRHAKGDARSDGNASANTRGEHAPAPRAADRAQQASKAVQSGVQASSSAAAPSGRMLDANSDRSTDQPPGLPLAAGVSDAPSHSAASAFSSASDLLQHSLQRAFGLEELGMFGLTSSVEPRSPATTRDTAALPSGQTIAQTNAAVLAPPASAPLGDSEVVAMAGSGTNAGSPVSTSDVAVMETSGVVDDLSSSDQVANVAIKATPSNEIAEAQQTPTPSRPGPEGNLELRQSALAKETPQSKISLIVSENKGAIQIVAATPGMDPQAAARLRRIADQTAAEFGRKLLTVHLNGSLIAENTRAAGGL